MTEIKKILGRKEFLLILSIMLFCVLADFLYGCYMFNGADLKDVISAYDATILSNNFNAPFGVIFALLMPLAVSIIASTIALEEKNQNILPCIYTRKNRGAYIKTQAISIFIVAFSVVFFCLLINLGLVLVVFPVQGYNTMFQADYAKILNVDPDFILDEIYRLHPYLNIMFFMLLRALFAGAFALFAYGVGFVSKSIKKIVVVFSPFVLVTIIQLVLYLCKNLLKDENIKLYFSTNILGMNHYGKLEVIFAIWFMIMFLAIAGIIKGIKTEDVLS